MERQVLISLYLLPFLRKPHISLFGDFELEFKISSLYVLSYWATPYFYLSKGFEYLI